MRFKVFFEGVVLAEERTAGGRLFHALGPAMANGRSPIVANVLKEVLEDTEATAKSILQLKYKQLDILELKRKQLNILRNN